MVVERKKRFSKSDAPLDIEALTGHTPPHDLDMERSILGCILLDSDILNDLAPILRTEDFYLDVHQILYRELLELYGASRQIDGTIFIDHLQRINKLNLVGGTEYLAEIIHSAPYTAHAKTYAHLVRDKAKLRQLIYASTTILQDAYQPEVEINRLISQAEERIFSVYDERSSDSVADIHQVLVSAWEKVDALANGGSQGVSTGFRDLDKYTGGLHKKELIILAARPSMGKTALATNIADAVAVKQRKGVLFVSLEMAKEELAMRMLCGRSRVDGQKVRLASMNNAERNRMQDESSVMMSAPLAIDDSASRTVSEIAAIARRQHRKWEREGGGLELLVIDYLQLIKEDDSRDARQEQVAKIARRLKGLARELNIPVLCLSQLNRQTEAGTDNRPRLSQLRESGAIEQDADVVMFVHREAYYNSKGEKGKSKGKGKVKEGAESTSTSADNSKDAEIIIAKQRNGPTGVAKLIWESRYTQFYDRASDRMESSGNLSSASFANDFEQF